MKLIEVDTFLEVVILLTGYRTKLLKNSKCFRIGPDFLF